ncbi:MAG: hypothetical protein AB2692_18695 [Candidatus Thiodiazotropha sp.]
MLAQVVSELLRPLRDYGKTWHGTGLNVAEAYPAISWKHFLI